MITLLPQTPKRALKAFLKQKPLRSEIDIFKINLIALLDKISVIEKRPKDESEEHLKNDLRDFLRDTYYRDTNAINTKDKKDLVIHLNKTTNSEVGVIIEAKRPNNIGEMVSANNPNKKALHELILYYLDERNKTGNFQLKQLVITNINEWYIIDANHFDKYIYNNTQIKDLYKTKTNDHKNNPFFYQEIEKIISKIEAEIPCVYFDIREYDTILRNNNKEDDRELIALYKILSPQHLLKLATPNDSNSLNERFYKELLHIIGLEEAKEGGKNIIRRKVANRNAASLIELTIDAIITEDLLHKLPDAAAYGTNKDERVFNVSLELCITWINRILFLKLLEGQLETYHQGNKEYRFLNGAMINSFDELFKLFHKVLAVNISDRTDAIQGKYSRVPYLNSSLFEISELEDQTIKINSLDNEGQLELIATTILKDAKKQSHTLPTLHYFFQFLDAYDFSSEGTEDVQEDNKALITASVLGKVFEKINGYKDGSIFTPAFITMYMCKQSIRLAVVEKFNTDAFATDAFAPSEGISKKGTGKVSSIEEIYELIGSKVSRKEANQIINSIKICDPAVGSGHFLVSALNEIIAIKSELGILIDENGKTLRDYQIEVIDDELDIRDENDTKFVYNYLNKESNRVQKTLFQEKQTIIENCLFGVDINPNSVKICRLRLWIELLKNAYYREEPITPMPSLEAKASVAKASVRSELQLETLPNIDINIKCGNSLLSRFAIDADLGKALKSIKYDVKAYRGFVHEYKNEKSREVKRGLQQIIDSIKNDFRTEIYRNDPKIKKLNKLQYDYNVLVAPSIFKDVVKEDMADYGSKENIKKAKERQKKLELDIANLTQEIEGIKSNAIYKNAFEWRFEFPEVLSNDGEFEGFDVVIGNPPYMRVQDIEKNQPQQKIIYENSYKSAKGSFDLANLFFELAINISKISANNAFIFPHKFLNADSGTAFRNYLIDGSYIDKLAHFGANMIFDNADTYTCIAFFSKTKNDGITFQKFPFKSDYTNLIFKDEKFQFLSYQSIKNASKLYGTNNWILFDNEVGFSAFEKLYNHKATIQSKFEDIFQGIATSKDELYVLNVLEENDFFYKVNVPIDNRIIEVEKEFFKPFLMGKEVQKFGALNPKRVVFFPYKSNKQFALVSENELATDFPFTYKYLMFYEMEFKKRESGKASKMKCWYAYIYPKNLNKFEKPKLSSMEICSNHPNVTLNFENYYHSTTVYSWVKKEKVKEDYRFFLSIINSNLFWWFLLNTGDTLQGDARRFKTNYLNPFPLPETVSDANQKPFIDLVDQIISQKQKGEDSTPLEKQIDALVYQLYDLTEEEIKIVEGK